ncbi:MAG: fumarylacetoacetate hydrolase family protein [Pigmentiphaga sp.]|uniref:fumarylacetoacetate hydrolase family protein n=1 Tax=Pigmentiphaga sp. TaxID=1977564 RepID=UPI0029B1C76F|nr:fumarylacetoacetate hydrolase family protein [Pigmentiphaga sp.]MDX3906621.1 fumarylacetoacetate hydrolase family protein [Pigmentiphaga sp.]
MKICRYDDGRLGLVEGDTVYDVSSVKDRLPRLEWPVPPGDLLIERLDELKPALLAAKANAPTRKLGEVRLLSPVATPAKVIAAPLNYHAHVDESLADAQIHNNVHVAHYEGFKSPVAKFGVFLKSAQSVVGAGEGVRIAFPGRRNDHEVELAVVIGRQGKDIPARDAMSYIAGYCIGLDMTVRGTEDRSYRKSADTYTVLGPYLVTADEVSDPGNLGFSIQVNGEMRQNANTRDLITGIAELIEIASHVYTLYPGDVIMTGTPEGVGTVQPGDVMHARIEGIGTMDVAVRG